MRESSKGKGTNLVSEDSVKTMESNLQETNGDNDQVELESPDQVPENQAPGVNDYMALDRPDQVQIPVVNDEVESS
ncbi:hypothetical protein V6N13_138400 [Hibiscus sabdariffa]|uniref:Uncharacterized protein n=1 Tax=Hibiscus sabdariffa TaxID=183260 RepID=A0ABR2QDA6_9ROSI